MSDNSYNPTRVEFDGYAAVFDSPDLSGDIIRAGAFNGLQKNGEKLIPGGHSRVMMLYQHAAEKPIGRWERMEQDENGLFVQGSIFLDTKAGTELYHLVKGGAIDGLSIGFSPIKSRSMRDGRRELRSIDLWEVSIVTFPMAPKARIRRIGDPGVPLPRNLL